MDTNRIRAEIDIINQRLAIDPGTDLWPLTAARNALEWALDAGACPPPSEGPCGPLHAWHQPMPITDIPAG